MSVEYIKSAPNAMQPLYLTSGSAGSDLFSIVDKIINRGETFGIDLGLNFKIPKGYFGLISGRSSIALKGIMTHVGIIDEDFYGSGKVILTNVGLKPFRVSSGDRIGQVTLVKYSKLDGQFLILLGLRFLIGIVLIFRINTKVLDLQEFK